jgi:hypothetical protein
MATFTPGYDFGAQETPRRETLLQQALGLKVQDLTQDMVDANIPFVLNGETSGDSGSSLPAEGWLWAAPDGSIWVETASNPAMLHRATGGWETVRYGFSAENQAGMPGHGAHFNAVAGSNMSGTHKLLTNPIAPNAQGYEPFVHAVSGVSEHARLVGRGVIDMGVDPLTFGRYHDLIDRDEGYRLTGGSPRYWNFGRLDSGQSDLQAWYGPMYGPTPNTSIVSLAPPDHEVHIAMYSYFYGNYLVGRGGTI